MKKLLIIVGILILIGLIAIPFITKYLAPNVISVPPPSGDPIGEVEIPRPETSLLSLRIRVPVQAIQKAANREAPRRITGSERKNIHKRVKNGSYSWNIARSNITIQNTGKSLSFSVPIDGIAKAQGEIDAKIVSIPLQGTAEIGGTIAGTVNPQIAPNWQIIPNLVPQLTLTKANLNIGQLGTIGIRDVLQANVNPLVQKEAKKIGPNLIKELNLKGEMQKLWTEAHFTDQVSEKPPIWVKVRPNGIFATPLDLSNTKEIAATIAIQSQTSLSNAPPAKTQVRPLPNLKIVDTPPKTKLRIPFIINLARLNQELSKEDISVKTSIGTNVKVHGVKVAVGQNGFLNFSINLNARATKLNRPVKGEIWLKGKPIIDYEAQTLAFSDVGFTVETKDTLATAAAWMLEELLVKSIEKQLRVDLKEYKSELDEEVAKALASDDIPEGLEISIQDLEVRLADIYTITKRRAMAPKPDPGVVVVIQATGEATTRVTDFEKLDQRDDPATPPGQKSGKRPPQKRKPNPKAKAKQR